MVSIIDPDKCACYIDFSLFGTYHCTSALVPWRNQISTQLHRQRDSLIKPPWIFAKSLPESIQLDMVPITIVTQMSIEAFDPTGDNFKLFIQRIWQL